MRQSRRLPLVRRHVRLCGGKHRLDRRQLDVLSRLDRHRLLRHCLLLLRRLLELEQGMTVAAMDRVYSFSHKGQFAGRARGDTGWFSDDI